MHAAAVVLVRQAHDCTDAQLDIVLGFARRGAHHARTRSIVVYDPHQCIYAFRGARGAATLPQLPMHAKLHLSQAPRRPPCSVAAPARAAASAAAALLPHGLDALAHALEALACTLSILITTLNTRALAYSSRYT